MGLTFNFNHCAGYDLDAEAKGEGAIENEVGYSRTAQGTYELAPKSNALVWHSLNTGIGTITERNAAEVFARIAFVEEMYGPSLILPNEEGVLQPYYLTTEDVRKHIGMKTNASFKDETRASFLKRHGSSMLDSKSSEYERKRDIAETTAAA